MSSRNVMIFRNELLPSSETFILAQANAMQRFRPVFAGVHPAPHSLELPGKPILLTDTGSLQDKLMRRSFWRFGRAPGFLKRVAEERPSLLHAHFALDGAAALPLCDRLGVPLIVTLHGYDVSTSDKALGRSPEGRAYLRQRAALWSKASAFLCVSSFIRDCALRAGFPAEKLHVHHIGINLRLFATSNTPKDPKLIVFVGRLVEKKGLHHLLDAMAILRQVRSSARLVIIGDGPMKDVLRKRITAESLPCKLLGRQPARVIRTYLARARVLSVPSIRARNGDCEGLGMVFIEAQAMGTPVASFNHGGIAEAVLDGRTGLLAPEGDSRQLATNILTLLEDQAFWDSCSQAGMQFSRCTFDIHAQTAELEMLYASVSGH